MGVRIRIYGYPSLEHLRRGESLNKGRSCYLPVTLESVNLHDPIADDCPLCPANDPIASKVVDICSDALRNRVCTYLLSMSVAHIQSSLR